MADLSLEPAPQEFQDWLAKCGEYLGEYLRSLPDQKAWDQGVDQAAVMRLSEPLPESGVPFEALLEQLFGECLTHSYNPATPGYLAYIPGGGLPQSAIADLISNVLNHYVGVWCAAPWLAQIEQAVVKWFASIVGYQATAGGFLTTGGSFAGWAAVTAAREIRQPFPFEHATVYASNQSHHSIAKAVRMSGVDPGNIRWIATDDRFRMRTDRLREAIESDREKGRFPWLLVGQAGTTNTGAVDDLVELGEIAREHKMWYHVDAAYGGFFMLTEDGRQCMRGIETADSLVLDPHKGMFLPYGTGCLLVKNRAILRDAFSLTSDYMPPMQESSDMVDFCDISPELSRDFRGLRVWLPVKMHGIAPFRNNLAEKRALAVAAFEALTSLAHEFPNQMEVIEPQLSVVAFRMNPDRLSPEQQDDLNRQWLKRINASKRVFLTPTVLNGRFTLRICVLSFRTHRETMDDCLQLVDSSARALLNSAD